MREPGAHFYQWLTQSGFRYPESRWEWSACSEFLARLRWATVDSSVPRIAIDIGCGDGKFLGLLSKLDGWLCIGLDLNPDMVSLCQRSGLEVIEGDMAVAKSKLPNGVDAVTLWHVVEHVEDPVGLLLQAKALLNEKGVLCFSVPLTPMSYEHSWPDPFNAPPHHLTRWGLSALRALAERLEMQVELILPEADSYQRRVVRSLLLQALPSFELRSRSKKSLYLLWYIVSRPWKLGRELWIQRQLPKVDGRVQPDVVLVCLRQWE